MLTGNQKRITSVPSTCTIICCQFISCSISEPDSDGGAISVSSCRCFVTACLFRLCSSAHYGGAVSAVVSSFSFDDTCFSECRSEIQNQNRGGNAIALESSEAFVNVVSIYKCAPDTTKCGDGSFTTIDCLHIVRNHNTSYCYALDGDASFGFFGSSNISVKYATITNNFDFCIFHAGRCQISYLSKCNFVSNTLSSCFCMSHLSESIVIFEESSIISNSKYNSNKGMQLLFVNSSGDHPDLGNKSFVTQFLSPVPLSPNKSKYGFMFYSARRKLCVKDKQILIFVLIFPLFSSSSFF